MTQPDSPRSLEHVRLSAFGKLFDLFEAAPPNFIPDLVNEYWDNPFLEEDELKKLHSIDQAKDYLDHAFSLSILHCYPAWDGKSFLDYVLSQEHGMFSPEERSLLDAWKEATPGIYQVVEKSETANQVNVTDTETGDALWIEDEGLYTNGQSGDYFGAAIAQGTDQAIVLYGMRVPFSGNEKPLIDQMLTDALTEYSKDSDGPNPSRGEFIKAHPLSLYWLDMVVLLFKVIQEEVQAAQDASDEATVPRDTSEIPDDVRGPMLEMLFNTFLDEWVDQPTEALDGKTPKQVAQSGDMDAIESVLNELKNQLTELGYSDVLALFDDDVIKKRLSE